MNTALSLDAILELSQEDRQAVDRLIRQQLHSDVVLVRQVGEHIILSGGKRLRPLIALLSARACGYAGSHHVHVAAIVEFIHTATLLHDDVVDESELRRGQDTANARFGNAASVLVGDFLYSRAFQMMVEIQSMDVMGILADTTNKIAEGEVLQLMNLGDPDTTEARYFEVIRDKTAKLFEAAACLGAVLAEQDQDTRLALARYGMALGMAFQLVDDILDYTASGDALGKNVGDDLAEGKPTLPLLRAMQMAPESDREKLRQVIAEGGTRQLQPVLDIIRATDALEYSRTRATEAMNAALECLSPLPDSQWKQALAGLARYALERSY